MAGQQRDPLSRGLSMAVALGALAFGAATAVVNSERTKQMRQDLERQIEVLSGKLERALEERKPEIEDAIQRSRKVAVDGLEKVKGAVEVSADKAQEYVHRTSSKAADATADTEARVESAMLQAGEPMEADNSDFGTGAPTQRIDGENDSNITNNPGY